LCKNNRKLRRITHLVRIIHWKRVVEVMRMKVVESGLGWLSTEVMSIGVVVGFGWLNTEVMSISLVTGFG
jgi:hypothetical protein